MDDEQFDEALKEFDSQFHSKPEASYVPLYPTQRKDVNQINAWKHYEHEYQIQRTNALVKFMIKKFMNK